MVRAETKLDIILLCVGVYVSVWEGVIIYQCS